MKERLIVEMKLIINTAAQNMLEELKNSQPFQIFLQITPKEWQTIPLEQIDHPVPIRGLTHKKRNK